MNDAAWWALIGTLVGALQAFTGVGGAILAIPLFMTCLSASLFQATVYALYAVLFGAVFNGYLQRAKAEFRVALLLGAFAVLGSALSKTWKEAAPNWVIQTAFFGVCAYALFTMVFAPKQLLGTSNPKTPRTSLLPAWAQTPVAGIFVGALTTLTGLGGGIFMVPWLHRSLKLPMAQAVPTSLIAVICSASAALFFQRRVAMNGVVPGSLVALGLGTMGAAVLARRILGQLSSIQAERIRRAVFVTVILISVLVVLIES